MAKILVTGGAGYIGSFLREASQSYKSKFKNKEVDR
jgi:nucleoside-diphosphate-sugar epimerase